MTAIQMRCIAAASVDAAGALITGRGCTSARNGAGDFTITLPANEGVDANECHMVITPRITAQSAIPRVVHTSDTAKQILLIDDAAGNADVAFDVAIFQLAAGDQ